MKQKKINDILYVFDITPYQITEDTDAEVIKVQEECVAGFKELNESLADKIVAYNYHIMCVQVPEWAPYVDEPDPTPKEDPELAWSAESATVTIGADDNVFPTLSNPHSVTVNYASGDESAATINESTGQITLVAAGSTTIYANFAGDETYEAQTVSYTLTVTETQKEDPELAWSAESATVDINDADPVFPTLSNPHNVTVTYASGNTEYATIDENTGEVALQAAGSTIIYANFAGDETYEAQTVSYALTVTDIQKEDPELAWSAESATVTIGAADNVFPTLSNPHSLTVAYNASNPEYATIDVSTGQITLVAAGATWIEATFSGDETYEAGNAAYLLTVEAATPE